MSTPEMDEHGEDKENIRKNTKAPRKDPHGGCQVNGPKVAKFLDR